MLDSLTPAFIHSENAQITFDRDGRDENLSEAKAIVDILECLSINNLGPFDENYNLSEAVGILLARLYQNMHRC
ncbi:hypothetical protein [Marinibactrum halimedae]|uniref:Uncharacterized protein n=1 Tax=Marinibactrum halimedae TaxID=1444977 RepID=A0AA37WMA8_9GAMM|nr:hypothetical protein [Marinibactrum halimedae]MCD9459155.1 hypothetical protein [Marinibactrum halimedae]GLS24756.1 hypothetical protein GCM10007877_04700 [Marinibactrum halimedae]